MMNIKSLLLFLAVLITQLVLSPLTLFADAPADAKPVDVPVEVLEMRVKHLDAEQLKAEADLWLERLQDHVRRLNTEKERVWKENQVLEAAKQAEAESEAEASTESGEQESKESRVVVRESARKTQMLDKLSALREERIRLIDRLGVVVDELSAKLGLTADDTEQDEVLSYRRYIDAVKGVQVDTSDFESLQKTTTSWLLSEEGGKRWLKHVAEFLAYIAGFWVLGVLLSRLAGKAMSLASGASQILRKFVVNTVRRSMIAVGLLLGLAAMEVNITPLVALIGATGFVIAFALQDTLSNFASGLMIMFYKPFDIGDFVETSEVSGKIRSMTLVTTNMMTPDNKLLVVPNNELWGKVITNVTGSSQRRVDLVFGIGYGDDIEQAERVLLNVVEAHPKVLNEPEPNIRVFELADSSVNLICRPWVKTEDYWEVYWDITRSVKQRFDAEGISIPFPQRDVHMYSAEQGLDGD